jgi:adenine-specific DNA methylase
MTAELERLTVMRRALAEAETVAEVAKIIDYAEAAKVAARKANAGEEAEAEWAGFSLEAQRDAGQRLANLDLKPGRPTENAVKLTALLEAASAPEAQSKSKRWQAVAAVPETMFRAFLNDYTTARLLTRGRLLREARDADAQDARDREAIEGEGTAEVLEGDFRDRLAHLRDVDAIITDPPYGRDALDLYADLATFADKTLKPDGVLVVLTGQHWLPEIMARLGTGRPSGTNHPRRVSWGWKPLLVYGDGPRIRDVFTPSGDDKRHHHWGQDLDGFVTIVERFTSPGALVVDPFLGGGTTALACVATGRRCIGAEIDPAAATTARQRLA